MIPIECPKCGRGGNVPPDRLNARLVCKACHTVFHMDASGHMVLGDPFDPAKDPHKKRATQQAKPDFEFDLAQTLRDIPPAVRFGVPGVVLALVFWLYILPLIGGPGAPAYQGRAESVIRALVDKDRAKVISLATPSTADTAGQWYDVMRGLVEKNQIGTDVTMSVALFSGNAETDNALTLWCIVYSNSIGPSSTVPVNIDMTRDGGDWMLDGTKSLSEAQKTAAASNAASKKS